MKDRIITSYLKDFTDEFGLGDLGETKAFEHFVSYCAVAKLHPGSFDPEDIVVGGGGDLGLDGIAILVNDHLVASTEAVDHLKKSLRRLDVQFLFVQAKTSPHFDGGEMGSFLSGVRQFFEKELPVDANAKVRALHSIKEHIFDSTIDMDEPPVCRLYYAATGIWKQEASLVGRINQGIDDLKASGLFSGVEFTPYDLESVKALYREMRHGIVREILFDKHVILPQIAGVKEAYIGIVTCSEYLKLLCDRDGTLNRRLFYDNVRDFQGHNPVNSEIEDTIRDAQHNDRFALLNNGVTLVARDANKVGARFKLVDYQIVNGCQTSHILYLNRDRLTPNVFVPFKLIVSTDSQVINQIIQGTNRQTEVKLEAFESLAPFQKSLEELYLALGRGHSDPLYYERRSKQYDHLGVPREQVVTLAGQIMCFLAMFLNEPHSTHRYYGELLNAYRNRIFGESHSRMPYYVSAASMMALDRLFARGVLPRTLKPLRYQILMVYRLQNEAMELPPLNSKAAEKYCDSFLRLLPDQAAMQSAFQKAAKLVSDQVARLGEAGVQPERSRVFTAALVDAASRGGVKAATIVRIMGTVKYFSDVRGYGFVRADDGAEFFVHYSGIIGDGYKSLAAGQRIQFALLETERGPRAVDVETVGDSEPA